jgi:hypothetical protein
MTDFILSLDGEPKQDKRGKEYPRRAILDAIAHGPELQTIQAEPVMSAGRIITGSAWLVAREKIDESKFFRFENEGYFPINR